MKNIQSALYLTPKATFYSSKTKIVNAGETLHDELLLNDRELYTYLLYFGNATYYSKSMIIENLLGCSINKPENKTNDERRLEIEDALIINALFNENMTHALKMLLRLKDKRINNKRTSNIILTFLFKRGNLDKISLKYKSKIKDLLVHALGRPTINKILYEDKEGQLALKKITSKYGNRWIEETIFFVFNKDIPYRNENFAEYIETRKIFEKKDLTKLGDKGSNLPIEVLIGFNNFYGTHAKISDLYKKAVVSDKQKIQFQNVAVKNDIEIEIDFNKYSILELFKYLYSRKSIGNHYDLLELIREKAKALSFKVPKDACLLWDCSASNSGSKESEMTPHYKNLVLAEIFNLPIYRVGGYMSDGLIYPDGDSDLTPALLLAVEDGYKSIYILSDGFENSGDFDVVYDSLLKLMPDIKSVHFNPVFSAKNFTFKTLHERIPTIPYMDEKDLPFVELFRLLNTDPNQFKSVVREKILSELCL